MRQPVAGVIPVVLVVPPIYPCGMPAVGVSILKAELEGRNILCRVVYVNMILAGMMGLAKYDDMCGMAMGDDLAGECAFSKCAYDLDGSVIPDNYCSQDDVARLKEKIGHSSGMGVSPEEWEHTEALCALLIDRATREIVALKPQIIGFSCILQQLNASIALARMIKRDLPETICALGGYNCEGAMGEEIADRGFFDYVFQGEADFTFVNFCTNYLCHGALPAERLIRCAPPEDLNSIPMPDYTDYFEQSRPFTLEQRIIPFESSRGCWWGQKHQCSFCGINSPTNRFRSKSAEKVFAEMESLDRDCPEGVAFFATDAICPTSYFTDLFPKIAARGFHREIFYEVKSNLTFAQLSAMKSAGIAKIQPGVESLSTRLLRLLNKGSNAGDTIRMLRDCRDLGISAFWNILVGIPGDKSEDYAEQARLFPLLQHLIPPILIPITIQRFSPYFEYSEEHGITDVRPVSGYYRAFPDVFDRMRLAMYFSAKFPSESRERPGILDLLIEHTRRWRLRWQKPPYPLLELSRLDDERWLVVDTRDCARESETVIDAPTYAVLEMHLTPRQREPFKEDERLDRLEELGHLVEIDGKLLTIVCGVKNIKTLK